MIMIMIYNDARIEDSTLYKVVNIYMVMSFM